MPPSSRTDSIATSPKAKAAVRTRGAAGSGIRRFAGRVDGAIVQFDALLADQVRILGADHPDTIRTRNRLTDLREGEDP